MTFEEIAAALRERLATLEPECYSGADAARHAEATAEIRNLGDTATILLAKRAADTRAWTRVSHAASAEQWLANVSGTSEHTAREQLLTAERLQDLPTTERKLRAGELSLAQATQVTAGAAVDPNAERHLLRVAERRGFRHLRCAKERVVAAASDETKARALAHRERHVRSWVRGFATHGTFSGPTEEVAKILEMLEPLERQAFEAARSTGKHESHDAYRFDALMMLAAGGAPAERTKRPEPVVRLNVGLQSLLEGRTVAGEVCEIPGVGPVPVAHAREVLQHGLLELVISDGVDVHSVVSTTRHIPKALKIAVDARDGGRCKVSDCDHTKAIERHHTLGFSEHRLTTYEVLGGVCPDHHDLITHRGYTVIENDDGTWSLRAPPHTSAA